MNKSPGQSDNGSLPSLTHQHAEVHQKSTVCLIMLLVATLAMLGMPFLIQPLFTNGLEVVQLLSPPVGWGLCLYHSHMLQGRGRITIGRGHSCSLFEGHPPSMLPVPLHSQIHWLWLCAGLFSVLPFDSAFLCPLILPFHTWVLLESCRSHMAPFLLPLFPMLSQTPEIIRPQSFWISFSFPIYPEDSLLYCSFSVCLV